MPVSTLDDLVWRWASGWAISRGLPIVSEDDTWLVRVNDVSRRREIVIAAPDEGRFANLAARIEGDTEVWLTVIAPDVSSYRQSAAWLDEATLDEMLMDCVLKPTVQSGGVLIESDGTRADARLLVDGQLAAVGSVAVVGYDAIFDRVETMPRFRRQGHGSALMAALTSSAYERGARHGLLAASADGQPLYRRLGWREAGAMVSFTGRPADANPA